jgi:predicted signal transduction protein with EAL and GGDEF domain
MGGDEFAILLPSVPSLAAADAVGTRITAAVAEPRPDTVVCTASVGLATTGPADDEPSLVRNAEHALSVAKAAGGNQWRRFEAAMADAVRYRTELRGALGQALRDGSLVVEYQPIVRLTDGKTLGFEALVRWQHPTRGLLSPSEFIDIAEDSGLITPIGEYVLQVATAAASTWGTGCFVTVNVSARQFRSRGFVGGVLAQLREVGLAPSRLVIEITESLLLRDDDDVWEDLNRLRQAGVRVAIDDFGTGYSSLGYLRQVPLDIVKLDRLFISTMASSDRQRDLVRGIVDLIRTLNLEVVAEGIETVPQRRLVAGIGCEYGQGFLFARPMSELDVQRWLARRSPELAAAAHRGSP